MNADRSFNEMKVALATPDEVVEALTQLGFYTEVSRLPGSGKIIRIMASKPRSKSELNDYPDSQGTGNFAYRKSY